MLPLLALALTLAPTGYITDSAHILSAPLVASLDEELAAFEASTTAEVAVATIPALPNDQTIETYAEELFQEWGVGKKGADNGVLLLVSKDDREMRIEVGYGLEPVITDIESAHIISEVLVPAFQTGDYDGGVARAVRRLEEDIREGAPASGASSSGISIPPWVIIFILVLIFDMWRARKGKRGISPIFFIGGGRDRGGGGGFGGFGGGSSGGGGASGRW